MLQGHGSLGNDHPISPAQAYFAKDLEQRLYDPDKARFHLGKAGLESLDIELHAAEGVLTGGMETAILFKESAKAAGINIEIVRRPADGYWAEVWEQGVLLRVDVGRARGPRTGCSRSDTRPKRLGTIPTGSTSASNQLLLEARAELDDARRHELYYEMQQIVRDDGGALIPTFFNQITGVSDRIGVPEMTSGIQPLDGCRNTSRWWFA